MVEDSRAVAAIIAREGRVLAAHRGPDDRATGWEFPGGGICAEETSEEAVKRAIRDALGMRLSTSWLLETVVVEGEHGRMSVDCYVCMPVPGEEPRAATYDDLRWLGRDDLLSVEWLPASARAATLLGMWWDQVFETEHV